MGSIAPHFRHAMDLRLYLNNLTVYLAMCLEFETDRNSPNGFLPYQCCGLLPTSRPTIIDRPQMDGPNGFWYYRRLGGRRKTELTRDCSKDFVLNTGSSMPAVAMGTRKCSTPGTVFEAVKAALIGGYRHIDSYVPPSSPSPGGRFRSRHRLIIDLLLTYMAANPRLDRQFETRGFLEMRYGSRLSLITNHTIA